MWMDLEMIKKDLEKRIADLEKEIAELKSAILSLSLRQPIFVPNPLSPAPPIVPTPTPIYPSPLSPTRPYIGDPIPGSPNYPIITCGTATAGSDKSLGDFQVWN